ncbi:MAG: hypothetical protein JOY61_03915 [Chloroflexi bacterium]|nr:hypothetical protein [Chloroflexota bacterium]
MDSHSRLIEDTQTRTTRPFGVNFIASPAQLAILDLTGIEIAATTARVVEFFFGHPNRELVARVHAGGSRFLASRLAFSVSLPRPLE